MHSPLLDGSAQSDYSVLPQAQSARDGVGRREPDEVRAVRAAHELRRAVARGAPGCVHGLRAPERARGNLRGGDSALRFASSSSGTPSLELFGANK